MPLKGICSLSALHAFEVISLSQLRIIKQKLLEGERKGKNTGEKKAARPGFHLSSFCSTVARREWAHGGQLLPPFPISPGSSSTEQWKGTLCRADLGPQKMRPWNLTTVTIQEEQRKPAVSIMGYPKRWAAVLQTMDQQTWKTEEGDSTSCKDPQRGTGLPAGPLQKKHQDAVRDASHNGCNILAFWVNKPSFSA